MEAKEKNGSRILSCIRTRWSTLPIRFSRLLMDSRRRIFMFTILETMMNDQSTKIRWSKARRRKFAGSATALLDSTIIWQCLKTLWLVIWCVSSRTNRLARDKILLRNEAGRNCGSYSILSVSISTRGIKNRRHWRISHFSNTKFIQSILQQFQTANISTSLWSS